MFSFFSLFIFSSCFHFYYLITLYFFNYTNILFMFLYYSIGLRNIHINPFCDSYVINLWLRTGEKKYETFQFLSCLHLYKRSCVLTKVSWFILLITGLRMNSKAHDCDQHFNLKSKEVWAERIGQIWARYKNTLFVIIIIMIIIFEAA